VRLTGSATEVVNHPEIASLYLGGTSASTASASAKETAPEPT
jgi:hypothetical protein